jgi:iron-sulfur cluster assembly protein
VSRVLTITETAAQAIDSLVASAPDLPDGGGLRIATSVGADGTEGFGLSLVGGPEPDDEVIEAASRPVFLERQVAIELDDKVLDAQVEGEWIGFVLSEQPAG